MAMQMGFLEKEQTKQKSSGLQELKAQRYSIEDKSRCVNLRVSDPDPYSESGSG
jgi:hypothetical protein